MVLNTCNQAVGIGAALSSSASSGIMGPSVWSRGFTGRIESHSQNGYLQIQFVAIQPKGRSDKTLFYWAQAMLDFRLYQNKYCLAAHCPTVYGMVICPHNLSIGLSGVYYMIQPMTGNFWKNRIMERKLKPEGVKSSIRSRQG